jgi:hypothetical protein
VVGLARPTTCPFVWVQWEFGTFKTTGQLSMIRFLASRGIARQQVRTRVVRVHMNKNDVRYKMPLGRLRVYYSCFDNWFLSSSVGAFFVSPSGLPHNQCDPPHARPCDSPETGPSRHHELWHPFPLYFVNYPGNFCGKSLRQKI